MSRHRSVSYGRFGVVWCTHWLEHDPETGERLQEPAGEMRLLASTDDRAIAWYLLSAWLTLAGHQFGDGVCVIVDRDQDGARVSKVTPVARPVLTVASLAARPWTGRAV